MPEEIIVNDLTMRRFQYRITAPFFKHHRGTIDVIALGESSCLVIYSTEADPRTMALTISGGTAGALDELKRQMEAADAIEAADIFELRHTVQIVKHRGTGKAAFRSKAPPSELLWGSSHLI